MPGSRYHPERASLAPRTIELLPFTGNNIIAFPEVGGLHHRYERRAA
jgi:hypothetical protein